MPFKIVKGNFCRKSRNNWAIAKEVTHQYFEGGAESLLEKGANFEILHFVDDIQYDYV